MPAVSIYGIAPSLPYSGRFRSPPICSATDGSTLFPRRAACQIEVLFDVRFPRSRLGNRQRRSCPGDAFDRVPTARRRLDVDGVVGLRLGLPGLHGERGDLQRLLIELRRDLV